MECGPIGGRDKKTVVLREIKRQAEGARATTSQRPSKRQPARHRHSHAIFLRGFPFLGPLPRPPQEKGSRCEILPARGDVNPHSQDIWGTTSKRTTNVKSACFKNTRSCTFDDEFAFRGYHCVCWWWACEPYGCRQVEECMYSYPAHTGLDKVESKP